MNGKVPTADRRIQRTKKSLRDALVALVLEKHYDAISVQDIINRADVGRSTFYLHFRDKEDLFRGDWQRVVEHFVAQMTAQNLHAGRIFPIRELFDHLKDLHHLYRALAKSGKIERLFSLAQKHLAEKIEVQLNSVPSHETTTNIPIPILANYLATEVFSNLKWWLDKNMPHTPERMDEMFHQLIVPGFRKGLKQAD